MTKKYETKTEPITEYQEILMRLDDLYNKMNTIIDRLPAPTTFWGRTVSPEEYEKIMGSMEHYEMYCNIVVRPAVNAIKDWAMTND